MEIWIQKLSWWRSESRTFLNGYLNLEALTWAEEIHIVIRIHELYDWLKTTGSGLAILWLAGNNPVLGWILQGLSLPCCDWLNWKRFEMAMMWLAENDKILVCAMLWLAEVYVRETDYQLKLNSWSGWHSKNLNGNLNSVMLTGQTLSSSCSCSGSRAHDWLKLESRFRPACWNQMSLARGEAIWTVP